MKDYMIINGTLIQFETVCHTFESEGANYRTDYGIAFRSGQKVYCSRSEHCSFLDKFVAWKESKVETKKELDALSKL